MVRVCVNCGDPSRPVNRPRGLCWGCYYAPGVRERFPSTSKYAVRGLGLGISSGSAVEATAAVPGSEAKILVMMGRLAARTAMHHAGDAKLAGVASGERPAYRHWGWTDPRRDFNLAADLFRGGE